LLDLGTSKPTLKVMTMQSDIGLIGLAVMGENLVLNMESKGFSVAVFNRTSAVTEKFVTTRGKEKNIIPTETVEALVDALKPPRKVMMMIKAGNPVDQVIGEVAPLLKKGDVLIDGGNSLFTDTQRRFHDLEGKGIHYVGCGVSGGEEGALKGPSLMPGGSRESYDLIAPIFRKIAAQVDGEPCCRYMGPDGAGHYVKMVHNGIEYGDMQLICEAYAILKGVLGLETEHLAEIFAKWNQGALESYLIEITASIFRKKDPDTGKPMVDVILDKAGQKGTGLWTLQSALTQSVVISTINAAVEARVISSRKDERVASSKILPQPELPKFEGNREELIQSVHDALYASKIISYAQGMELLGAASTTSKWNLNLATSLPSGVAGASFARNSSTVSSRLTRATPACTIYCWTNISPISSPGRSITGALRFRLPSIMAWRRLLSAPLSPISIAIVPRACRQICCRRNATTSAPIPTSASISPEFSIPTGLATNPHRKSARPNQRQNATPASNGSVEAGRVARFNENRAIRSRQVRDLLAARFSAP